MLGNAAGTLRDANVHWVPAEAPESRPNPHLKSLDPVFQPHCTLSISFNSSKTCDSSYGAGANELVFSSRSSRLIFTLHVCACEPAAIRPSLDFIYPLVLKKTCFTKKFILEPGHRKLFFNQSCHLYFLCFLNLSGVELCVQQVQHGQNVVFPFAVACRFLDLFQCCTNCAYPLYFRGSLTFISAARGDSSLGNLDSRSFCRGSFAMALLTRFAFWQQSYRHV